jgi:hypothetical protein
MKPTSQRRCEERSAEISSPPRPPTPSFAGSKEATTTRGASNSSDHVVRAPSRTVPASPLASLPGTRAYNSSARQRRSAPWSFRFRGHSPPRRSSVGTARRGSQPLGLVSLQRRGAHPRHRDDRSSGAAGRVIRRAARIASTEPTPAVTERSAHLLPRSASNKNFATCLVVDFARARKRVRAARAPREQRGPEARLARAVEWQRELDVGEIGSRAGIARREGISRGAGGADHEQPGRLRAEKVPRPTTTAIP